MAAFVEEEVRGILQENRTDKVCHPGFFRLKPPRCRLLTHKNYIHLPGISFRRASLKKSIIEKDGMMGPLTPRIERAKRCVSLP
jgi:hypothetical protein